MSTAPPDCPDCGSDVFVEGWCGDEHHCCGCDTVFGGDARCPECYKRFDTQRGRRVHQERTHGTEGDDAA